MKRMLACFTFIVLGLFVGVVFAEDEDDLPEAAMLSSMPPLDQSTSLVTRAQYNQLQRANINTSDIGKVDVYTGKLNMVLPLIHVPMNDGLAFNLVLRYLTLKPSLSSTLPNTSLERGSVKHSAVGQHWQLYSGIIDSAQYVLSDSKFHWHHEDFQRHFPVFYDPKGGAHIFYPRDGAYYSKDNWKATLQATPVVVGRSRHLMVYSGVVMRPDGVHYIVSDKPGDKLSTLDKIISAHGGSEIAYHYDTAHQNQLTSIEISGVEQYRVNFEYDDNGLITAVTSNADESWRLHYSRSVHHDKSYLDKLTLHDGTSWLFDWLHDKTKTVIARVTNPAGGVASYTYIPNPGSDLCGLQVSPYSVESKTLSSPSMQAATWKYQYEIKRHYYAPAVCDWRQYSPRPGLGEHTVVIGPNKKIDYQFGNGLIIAEFHGIRYYAWTDVAPAADAGVIKSKSIYSLDDNLLERDDFIWRKRKLSNAPQIVGDIKQGSARDTNTMDLVAKTSMRGGSLFKTEYKELDEFGRAKTIVETGPSGDKRITHKSYYTNKNKWILKDKNSVQEGGESLLCEYNDAGLLVRESKNGVGVQYTYDEEGDLLTSTNALGGVTHFSHYMRGIPLRETDAMGNVTTHQVDPVGNVVHTTDALGRHTDYRYDKQNRLIYLALPSSSQETIQYSGEAGPGGEVHTVENHKAIIRRDGFGKAIQIESQDTDRGEVIYEDKQYDGAGQLVFESYPYNKVHSDASHGLYKAYDALGRLVKTTWPTLGNNAHVFFSRYLSGIKTMLRDAAGNETIQTRQAYGDPESGVLIQVVQPEGVITNMKRNVRGDLLSVTQGNMTRRYQYDNQFNLVAVHQPEIGVKKFSYDLLGNMLTRQVGDAAPIYFSYNALSHLTKITYPDAPALIKHYDKLGRVIEIEKGDVKTHYCYSRGDEIETEVTTVDGHDFTSEFWTDMNDHLMRVSYALDGKVHYDVNYVPDAFGRETRVNGDVRLQYFPGGQVFKAHYKNGVEETRSLDDDNRTTKIHFQHADWSAGRAYEYDMRDNLVRISDDANADYNIKLAYDKLNRLTGAKGVWGEGRFSYDVNGNITHKQLGDTVIDYSYDNSGKLSGVRGKRNASFMYDAYGNVIDDGKHRYIFHADGNLAAVLDKTGKLLSSMKYDGNGNRIAISEAGKTRYEYYNHKGELAIQEDADASQINIYLHGSKFMSHRVPKTGWYEGLQYFYNDLLGSPIASSDYMGKLLWQQHYYPYGRTFESHSDQKNHAWYTGKIYDDGDGLYYYGARYYDPMLSRFMSVDPVPFTEAALMSFNRYAYANDNPYRYLDPDGNFSWDFTDDISGIFQQMGAVSMKMADGITDGMAFDTESTYHKGSSRAWSFGFGVGAGISSLLLAETFVGDLSIELPFAGLFSKTANIPDRFSRVPLSLQDEMTLNAAKELPGETIISELGDPRFRGMDKIRFETVSNNGVKSRLHYVRNPKTGEKMDFKFKVHSRDKIGRYERHTGRWIH